MIAILLVDDEPGVHLMVGMFLRKAGYFVACANDGPTALRMFKERSWDLVITDRSMPRMGGEELAEEIRKIASDVPVILVTGYLKSDTRADLFDEVLEKPFTRDDLLATIRKVLEMKPVDLLH
jgi:CheY-like chemotaxis protein